MGAVNAQNTNGSWSGNDKHAVSSQIAAAQGETVSSLLFELLGTVCDSQRYLIQVKLLTIEQTVEGRHNLF